MPAGSIADALRAAVGSHSPILIFLAGPNGAGKSTFHRSYLEGLGIPFVNADNIRRKLPTGSPEEAAEADVAAFYKAEEFRRTLLDARASFCTETVFSDPGGAKLEFLRQAREADYTVFLIFIGLESAALSSHASCSGLKRVVTTYRTRRSSSDSRVRSGICPPRFHSSTRRTSASSTSST